MQEIDITIVATLRPGILDRTLKSFCRNIFADSSRYRVVINVDPVGNKRFNQQDVLNIAKKYFNNVVYNFPDTPNFAKAVKWCWSHTKSNYVFHLEDDWSSTKKINIDDLIYVLDKYPDICSVRLSQGRIKGRECKCGFLDNKDKGMLHIFSRISLNPTMFRGTLVRDASSFMLDTLNPESQLVSSWASSKRKDNIVEDFYKKYKWKHSVYRSSNYIAVKDLGYKWRRKNKIHRKSCFLTWG